MFVTNSSNFVSTYADMKLIPGFTFVVLIARVRYVHVVYEQPAMILFSLSSTSMYITTSKVATTFLLNTYLIHLWLERAIKSNGKKKKKNISISFLSPRNESEFYQFFAWVPEMTNRTIVPIKIRYFIKKKKNSLPRLSCEAFIFLFFIYETNNLGILLEAKYSHPFLYAYILLRQISRHLASSATNNKNMHRNGNRNVSLVKRIFERIGAYPGRDYGLYFPLNEAGSCAEETGRGRGCWRTNERWNDGRKGGGRRGIRLVSLRFNRNPMETCANTYVCTQGRI